MENEPRPNQEQEKSSEKTERIQFLVEAFEDGLNSPDIIGYHGTSIQTIEHIIKFGKLPGSENSKLSTSKEGVAEFSIFYLGSEQKDKVYSGLGKKFHKNDKLLGAAASYASTIAERHYFAEQLGLPAGTMVSFLDANILREDYIPELIERFGVTKEQIYKAINATMNENPQGVVLGISSATLKNYEWLETTEGGEFAEVVIKIPEGFSYKQIAGIEPQGQGEYDYFTKLQEQTES